LLLALKSGHERITSLLAKHGAALNLEDAGGYLCRVVTDGKVDLLSRLLRSGVDPNCRNYDQRTPLHVAAAEGLHLVASMLVGFGADVLAKDRCVAACHAWVFIHKSFRGSHNFHVAAAEGHEMRTFFVTQ
jgi:potassium channel